MSATALRSARTEHLPPCPQHPNERAAGWGCLPCDCGAARMYFPQVIYAGMPARIRWGLAWRIARVCAQPELVAIQPYANRFSPLVWDLLLDAERLRKGLPTVLQEMAPGFVRGVRGRQP